MERLLMFQGEPTLVAASDFRHPSCRDGALLPPSERAANTARVLTQRVGNVADGDLPNMADGDRPNRGDLPNLADGGSPNLTDGDAPSLADAPPTADGDLHRPNGGGRTLHEVIRATVLALGRGAGALCSALWNGLCNGLCNALCIALCNALCDAM